jgi:hypothetical protein
MQTRVNTKKKLIYALLFVSAPAALSMLFAQLILMPLPFRKTQPQRIQHPGVYSSYYRPYLAAP